MRIISKFLTCFCCYIARIQYSNRKDSSEKDASRVTGILHKDLIQTRTSQHLPQFQGGPKVLWTTR